MNHHINTNYNVNNDKRRDEEGGTRTPLAGGSLEQLGTLLSTFIWLSLIFNGLKIL